MDEFPVEKKLCKAPEWPLTSGQLAIVEELWSASKSSEESELSPLFPLLDAVQDSTNTLLVVSEGGRKVRDAYVLARVVYETSVNAAFILAAGVDAADRAWRHAKQKSIRDLERKIEVADERIHLASTAAPDAFADPDNQSLLAEFTHRSGRENTAWTPENIRERLAVILRKNGRKPAIGFLYGLLLYRHSSEIAHGTLFGALYSYGATDPRGHPKTLQEITDFRYDQLRLILMLIGATLNSLNQLVGRALEKPDLVLKSNKLYESFRHRPKDAADI